MSSLDIFLVCGYDCHGKREVNNNCVACCLRLVLLLFSCDMTVSVSVLSLSSRSWSRSTAARRSLRIVPRTKQSFITKETIASQKGNMLSIIKIWTTLYQYYALR